MAATTMPSTRSLLRQLRLDYPDITFTAADDFRWSPSKQTLYYMDTEDAGAFILHELAHASLQHTTYNKDIELIQCERDAWQLATNTFAKTYNVTIDSTLVQDNLDTYRDWLHARSTCPSCTATGVQTKQQLYHCVACRHDWTVNEARNCQLRRYSAAH